MIVWWSRVPPHEAEVSCWLEATVEDVERLMGALDSRDRRARAAAARVLERLRAADPRVAALGQERALAAEEGMRRGFQPDAEAVMPLIGALHHSDSEAREVAATLLGDLADARAVAPLLRALNDGLWFVRRAAAAALGRLGDPAVVPELRARALGESVPSVRQACWEAIRQLQDETAAASEVVPAAPPYGLATEPAPASGSGWQPGTTDERR